MKRKIKYTILGLLITCAVEYSYGQNIGYGTDFHEFKSKFFRNYDYQVKNISFPLLSIIDSDTTFIQQNDWKKLDYCFGCEYSTLLFMGDSINFDAGYYSINEDNKYIISVYIKPEKNIKSFCFSKINNSWRLDRIVLRTLTNTNTESFFDFIDRFSTDIGFVEDRLSKDCVFISYDFNQDQIREVEFPCGKEMFENHNYLFESIYPNNIDLSVENVFIYIRGEGTGYHLEYYFNKINGKWYLSKYVNLGV